MTDKTWTFQELVDWATWEIVQAIVKGQSLRSAVFTVIEVARRAKLKEQAL